ncbi:MAG: DNA end protector protein [Culicoidibacterales bacterium]
MIFESIELPATPAERRNAQQWIQIGVDFMKARKEKPTLTGRDFANIRNLKYETFRRAMTKHTNAIKKEYLKQVPNKTKAQWVALGVEWLEAKEKGVSAKKFTDDYKLNYETATRAFRKYKVDIVSAKLAKDASTKKTKLSAAEKRALMLKSFRDSVRVRGKEPAMKSERKSQEWFNSTVKKNIRGHQVSRPSAGKIYAFAYDAKHKATLPYWDMYPLIVYLGQSTKNANLMVGLNLHYIPPKARVEFLEELLKYASTDTITNKTRLKINWDKVKSMRFAKHMIKTYLPSHVKGTFVEIKPADWANAVFLPVQRFVTGENNKTYATQKVWAQK